jgi:prepilin-type N-terminal cleavage/methylation domain-containing protein
MTRLRILRRLGRQGGYTLIELLLVCAILGTVLASLTILFVSASKGQIDANRRYRAQQDARVAVDKVRREVHCASQITPAGVSTGITVQLPSQCPTGATPGIPGGALTNVTYDVVPVAGSSQRFQLRRNTVVVADYVSEQNAFKYDVPVASTSRGRLRMTLPINVEPTNPAKEWRLVADIVLRNTTR